MEMNRVIHWPYNRLKYPRENDQSKHQHGESDWLNLLASRSCKFVG
jgi:hypothetical protein